MQKVLEARSDWPRAGAVMAPNQLPEKMLEFEEISHKVVKIAGFEPNFAVFSSIFRHLPRNSE